MHILAACVHIYTKNMKFLCLTMWLGGLYTDNDTNANADTDTDSDTDPNNDGQRMIV